MATNQINVRTQNKYDTLSNWTTNNPTLLLGEIAFIVIPESSNENGIIPPAVVYKVGDGEKAFNDLPWGQSVSADVYAWAKAATKPTYQASEIQGLDDYISGKVNDTNTTYSFSIAGNIISIKKKDVGEADFSDYQTITLPQPDLSGYATKVASATEGHLAGLDASGNLTDSGVASSAVVTKVSGAVESHLAGLNTDGSIKDSGIDPTTLATKTDLSDAISGVTSFDYQVVESLPQTGVKGTIYLVDNSGTGQNVYDEYIWMDTEQKYEKIGTTEIDLSGYATKEELETGLDTKVTGLASGTTAGHVVTWGADGYTVADSGFTIASNVPSNAVFTDTGITSVVANNGLTQSISDRALTLGIESINANLITQTSGDYLILNCGSSSVNI